MSSYCFFFFFQAEDGIRDGRVTGVQTCALPISVCANVTPRRQQVPRAGGPRWTGGGLPSLRFRGVPRGPETRRRSEERRVGKEWRSEGRPEERKSKRRATTNRCTE